jgi:hypothetical protein
LIYRVRIESADQQPGLAVDLKHDYVINFAKRVFAQDVLPCACGGRRTVVAFVADADLTRSLLTDVQRPLDS